MKYCKDCKFSVLPYYSTQRLCYHPNTTDIVTGEPAGDMCHYLRSDKYKSIFPKWHCGEEGKGWEEKKIAIINMTEDNKKDKSGLVAKMRKWIKEKTINVSQN